MKLDSGRKNEEVYKSKNCEKPLKRKKRLFVIECQFQLHVMVNEGQTEKDFRASPRGFFHRHHVSPIKGSRQNKVEDHDMETL